MMLGSGWSGFKCCSAPGQELDGFVQAFLGQGRVKTYAELSL